MRCFPFPDIAPNGLAELLLVTEQIEVIVLQLKCAAIVQSKLAQCCNVVSGGAGKNTDSLNCSGNELGSFPVDNAVILLKRVILERCHLELQYFSFAHGGGGACQ